MNELQHPQLFLFKEWYEILVVKDLNAQFKKVTPCKELIDRIFAFQFLCNNCYTILIMKCFRIHWRPNWRWYWSRRWLSPSWRRRMVRNLRKQVFSVVQHFQRYWRGKRSNERVASSSHSCREKRTRFEKETKKTSWFPGLNTKKQPRQVKFKLKIFLKINPNLFYLNHSGFLYSKHAQ